MLTQTNTVLCSHCALEVPAKLVEPNKENQFCCAGCRAVYESVRACGLDNYYKLRDAAGATLKPARPGEQKFEAFDSPAFERIHDENVDANHRSVDLMLEGVTCGACVWLVEKLPQVLPGVIEARLSLRQSVVRVTWDSAQVKLSQIAETLDRFGYTPHPARGQQREAIRQKELRNRLIKLGAAGAIMGNLMLLAAAMYAGWWGGMEGAYAMMFRWFSLAMGLITLSWPGGEFFRSAFNAIRNRRINLDVPICIALATGGVAGFINVILNRGEIYFDSLGMLVFLLLVGRFLQFGQQRKAEGIVELLFSMTPTSCRVVRGGTIDTVPIEALQIGDLVEVRPNELLPADGVVEAGDSRIDQALLTGESMPVHVRAGAEVFGGSQNGPGVLQIRITQTGQSTRVGKLMRLVEQGLTQKPDIVRFADKVGVWFTVLVTLIGALTFACWWHISLPKAIDCTVAFLIVTCPCVLGLATAMTLAVAIGQLAKRDVLVKSAGVIERLSRGGEIILDKTGTLTLGKLCVQQWFGDDSLRGVVAQIEAKSAHPIARALHDAFVSNEPPANWRGPITGITDHGDGGISASINGHTIRIGCRPYINRAGINMPDEFESVLERCEHPALTGVQNRDARTAWTGQSAVLVAVDDEILALVVLSDSLREGSINAVSRFRAMDFEPRICSGDSQAVVDQIADRLEIDSMHAIGRMQPEDKLAVVHRLADENVVMVGDGVNDAAALAAASVGIAVHGGAEASLAAADVYIARPGLTPVVDLVITSRRAMRVIRGNFIVSLAYNIFAGVLAATGLMNPLVAAIVMPLSSATVLCVAVAAMKRRGRTVSE